MLKQTLILSALFLTACSGTDAPSAKSQDVFLTKVQADFPATLSKIADNVWVHTTNYKLPGQNPIASNGLVVVDGNDVILVDGAWGELATVSLLEKIRSETGKSVTKMVVTNHHSDRTAGVDAAEWQGVKVFTHPETPALAARAGFPAPNTSVAALKAPKSRTKVGSLEVAYPGHGYSSDNLVVYIPSAEILFGGSAVRGAGAKTLGKINNADLTKWSESLQWVKATYPKAKVVVPGHGKGSNLSLIDGTLALIKAEIAKTDDKSEAP